MKKRRKRPRESRKHLHPTKAGLLFDRAVLKDAPDEKEEDYIDYSWVNAHKERIEEYFTSCMTFFTAGWRFYEDIDQAFTERCFSIDSCVQADIAATKNVMTLNYALLATYLVSITLIAQLLFGANDLSTSIRSINIDAAYYAGIASAYAISLGAFLVCYRNRQENNAHALDKRIKSRLLRFKTGYERAMRRIHEIENVQGLDDKAVVDQAGDWALVCVWIPARALHLCRFVRNQLYQLDKAFWVTKVLAFSTLILGSIYLGVAHHENMIAGVLGAISATAVCAAFLMRPRELIQKSMDPHSWDEYASLRVHDTFKDIVRIEKMKYLNERNRHRDIH